MRSYGIYKVKKMYEDFIIGREPLLYDLLKENGSKGDNSQEIKYLCDAVERESIEEAVLTRLGDGFKTKMLETGQYKLTHPVKGEILITFSSYSLYVECNGSRMLDLDLFVALSEADSRFFAVMEGQGEWGWLKPVKHTEQNLQRTAIFR